MTCCFCLTVFKNIEVFSLHFPTHFCCIRCAKCLLVWAFWSHKMLSDYCLFMCLIVSPNLGWKLTCFVYQSVKSVSLPWLKLQVSVQSPWKRCWYIMSCLIYYCKVKYCKVLPLSSPLRMTFIVSGGALNSTHSLLPLSYTIDQQRISFMKKAQNCDNSIVYILHCYLDSLC